MRWRPVVLLAVVAGAVVLVLAATGGDEGSPRVADDSATIGRSATTLPRVATTVAPAVPTTTVPPLASAEAVGSEVYAAGAGAGDADEPPGLVITNSGSATASVGGNIVAGGTPVTVITGDATAVGNSSSVRTP